MTPPQLPPPGPEPNDEQADRLLEKLSELSDDHKALLRLLKEEWTLADAAVLLGMCPVVAIRLHTEIREVLLYVSGR